MDLILLIKDKQLRQVLANWIFVALTCFVILAVKVDKGWWILAVLTLYFWLHALRELGKATIFLDKHLKDR